MLSESTPNPEREKLARVIEAGWGDPTWDGKTLRPIDRKIADAVIAAGYRPQDDTVATKYHDEIAGEAQKQIHALEGQLAERTTELTNLEAGFKTFMKSHNQVLDELAEARAALATTGGETEWEQLRSDRGWPTPHALRRAAEGVDLLAIGKFGSVLRYVADRCDGVAVDPTRPETTEVQS